MLVVPIPFWAVQQSGVKSSFVEIDRCLLFRQIHTYAFYCCMIFDSARGFRIHYSASMGHGSVRAYPCVDERTCRVCFGSR
jgi:hypothetical protein